MKSCTPRGEVETRLNGAYFFFQIFAKKYFLWVTRLSEANDASFSDFFICHFLATFSFFHSPRPSLLPPSFLLVPPSSLSLFFSHPALSKSFRIHRAHFSLILTKALRINQPTDQSTNQPTDIASYRDADSSKKRIFCASSSGSAISHPQSH